MRPNTERIALSKALPPSTTNNSPCEASRPRSCRILHNPKYTGYQVFNRRASKTRRNRANPPADWTWSTEPAHPAIVTLDEFRQVEVVADLKARSRRTNAPARPAPTRGDYLFRSMLTCGCGLRMRGCDRKQTLRYYVCQPSRLRGRCAPTGHPPAVYVAEAALLDGVTKFLATAVYGPDRVGYWQQVLTADTPDLAAPARARIAELERETADLQARIRRQVLSLEDEQTSAEARQPIVDRIAELRRDLAEREAALAKLRDEAPPPPPDPQVVGELLAPLPLLDGELRGLSKPRLRELLESLNLTARYDYKEHTVQIAITLTAGGQGGHKVVPLVCSGGRTRTYNLGLNRAPLCRLSYAGLAGRWYTTGASAFRWWTPGSWGSADTGRARGFPRTRRG